MKVGWISLHRKILDNWIWRSKEVFDKRSAWIDLLLIVNHKTERIKFGKGLIEVERGQIITSLDKLAERWKWSRHKVSDFLDKLEKENMILQIRDTKKTLVCVLNYDRFQKKEGTVTGINLDTTSDMFLEQSRDIKK